MEKRILIYTNHFFPENFKVNEIAEFLMNSNYHVKVITGLPNYPSGRIFKGYGFFSTKKKYLNDIDVVRLPLLSRGSASYLRLFFNYFSYFFSCVFYTIYIALFEKKFDTVFVHHTSPILITIPPIIYSFFTKSKLVLWDLDMWPETLQAMDVIKSKKIINIFHFVINKVYKKYNHVLLGSKSFIDIAKNKKNKKEVSYFPNWSEKVFTLDKSTSKKINHKFRDGLTFTYAGNIGEAQDFESIFKALLILKDYKINWLIVGDGRSKEYFMNKVCKNKLSNRVSFIDSISVDFMPYIFSKSHVLFLSLRNKEIFAKTVPAKLQSYMCSSKPVLAMLNGEGASIIKKAQCGYAVNSGDYNSFANAAIKLYNMSNDELNEIGQNGKDYYDRTFAFHLRSKQLLDIL